MTGLRKLGVIGGMSWESTALYYSHINRMVSTKAGSLHSAPLLIESVDFQTIVALQQAGAWPEAGDLLAESAQRLERAGAEAILLAVNTMHRVADRIATAITVPMIHIADIAATCLKDDAIQSAALLGTTYVAGENWYADRLTRHWSGDIVRAAPDDAAFIHTVIYDELSRGVFSPETRLRLAAIIRGLQARYDIGAVVLACTELPLVVDSGTVAVRIIDTTLEHAHAGARFILGTEDRLFP